MTGLTEGDYTFRVYANDSYDNSNVTSGSVASHQTTDNKKEKGIGSLKIVDNLKSV